MMRYPIFRHADGDLYARVEPELIVTMKMLDGDWRDAVAYRPVRETAPGRFGFIGRRLFVTTAERFAERFQEIPDARK